MPHDASRARDAAPVGAALREAKRALRESVLARRDAIPPPVRRAAARAIAASIAALPSFAAARHVLMTLPFRNEWDTRPLFAAAFAAGKQVALPRVDTRLRMLDLFEVTNLGRDVATGFHGIDEPLAHCATVDPATIDWVLVPGVAFDTACRRLGYGGGYYDRLLPLVDANAPRIAGAFDVQIVERVPAAPHDLAVDAVFTESRLFANAK
ncbi:MAG: 5-formyltetrahydrofolate cyclo-ligase [Burkholderiales bacterium]